MDHQFLIVVINGPPYSGKDTIIGKLMQATTPYCMLNHRHIQGWHEKMIMPLRDMVCNLFNIGGFDYELNKDKPILPNAVTPRQAIIALDVEWARPLFGEDFLGRLLVKELERHHKRSSQFEFNDQVNVHFVDAGVEAEFQTLKNEFGRRVKVIRILRADLQFDATRQWLSQCDAVVSNDAGVPNSINIAVDRILICINRWLEELDDNVDAGVTEGVSTEGKSDQPQS